MFLIPRSVPSPSSSVPGGSAYEVRLASAILQQATCPVVADKRDALPAFDGLNGHLVGGLPAQDADVIGYGPQKGPEGVLGAVVAPVGASHFGKQAYEHPSRKVEAVFQVVVDALLRRVLAERARLPGYLRNIVTGGCIYTMQGRLERLLLRLIGKQLDHNPQLHAGTMLICYERKERSSMHCTGIIRFLLAAEVGGFMGALR